jgi:hypothetical protein
VRACVRVCEPLSLVTWKLLPRLPHRLPLHQPDFNLSLVIELSLSPILFVATSRGDGRVREKEDKHATLLPSPLANNRHKERFHLSLRLVASATGAPSTTRRVASLQREKAEAQTL